MSKSKKKIKSSHLSPAALLAKANHIHPPTQPNGFQFESAKQISDPRLRTLPSQVNQPVSSTPVNAAFASNTVQGPASIVELSRALDVGSTGDGPQFMYEWVYNNIEWEPGWGVYKGALGCLMDGMGNSFDQSLLLAELLREAGYTANIIRGTIRLYESDYQDWWDVASIWAAQSYCLNQFIPIVTAPTWDGSKWYMDIKHVWVAWVDGGTTYYFDPSRKEYTRVSGLSSSTLASAMGYTASTFKSNAESGATIDGGGDYVQKMNRGNIRSDLEDMTMDLVDYINDNVIGSAAKGTATLDDILGGQTIVPVTIPLTQTSLPYQKPGDSPDVWTGDVPSAYKPTFQVQMVNQDNPNNIDFTYQTTSDALAGKRLTLFYDGSDVPKLYLDGTVVATGVAQDPMKWATWLIVTVTHPAYASSQYPLSFQQWYQTNWQWNQAGMFPGGKYLIGNAWGNLGSGQTAHHQKQLAAEQAAGGSSTSEEVLGEKMAVAFFSWASQNSKVVDIENRLRNCHTLYNHQVGVVSFDVFSTGAIALDLGGISVSSTNFDNDTSQTPPNDRVIAMHGVALEAAVCAQMTGLTPGISTTTVVDEACRTVRATIGGTVTASDVLTITVTDSGLSGGSKDVDYTVQGGDSLADIAEGLADAVNADSDLEDIGVTATFSGAELALYSQSENETTYSKSLSGGATETITLAYDKIYKGTSSNWNTGTDVESILVGNGYNSSDMSNLYNAWIQWGNTAVLADHPDQVLGDWTGWGDWVYPAAGAFGFVLGGYKGGGGQPGEPNNGPSDSETPEGTDPSSQEQIGDPMGSFSGDFFYSREDISVGSSNYPYKLSFQRFYNSASQYANGSLGRGWTHNYLGSAVVGSSGLISMGKQSALQAAATIVQFFVNNDIASDTTFDISKLVIMSLADKWWVDQIVNNTVVVSTDSSTEVFVRMPDGTYVQPVNNASKLTISSGLFKLTDKNQVEYNYNSDGNLSTIAFPYGVTITLTYSSGKLSTISNGMGRTLTLTYTGDLITSVSDGNGRSVSYTYDGNDNLTEFENTLSKSWTYEYDQPGRMTKYYLPINPTTAFVTNAYDSLSRIKTQKNARNQTWTYYFAGSRTEEIDPLSNSKVRYMNKFGKVVRYIDPLGNELTSEYDGLNRIVKTTLPEGNAFEWTYDVSTNVLTEVQIPKSGSGLSNITRSWTYDSTYNQVLTYTDGKSNTFTWNYDNTTGKLLTVSKPAIGGVIPKVTLNWNNRGQLLSSIDETGIQTQYTYDSSTEKLTSIEVNTNWIATIGGTPTTSDVITITVNDSGLSGGSKDVDYTVQGGDGLADIAEGLSDAVNADTDLADLGIVAYLDDTVISLSTSPGNSTTFSSSISGSATETVSLSSGLELEISMTYDSVGNTTGITDALENETEFNFDTERRPTKKTDPTPLSYEMNIGYDDFGNVTSIQKQKDSTPTWQTYTFTYSATNKRLTSVDPASNSVTWTYDGKDRLATQTDAESREWQYAYDEIDRISEVTDPTSTASDARTYTDNGKLESITDARGNTTDYTYDGHDRMDKIIYEDTTFEQNSSYDANNNVLTRVIRSGDEIDYTYDALNRVATKSPDSQPVVSYEYDLAGRLIKIGKPTVSGDPSSGDLNISFDSAGRFFQEKYPDGKTVTHELDDNGNRTKTTWPDGYYVTRVYDKLNRLTDVKLNGATTSALVFEYDYLSRRTKLTYGNGAVINYGYADNNDITSLEQVYNGSTSVEFTYGYNDVNEETSRSIDDATYMWHPSSGGTVSYGTADDVNKYPSVGGSTYSYDGNKNLTDDSTWTYSYDTENHLLSANKTGVSASMVYDPVDRQSQKTVGSNKTRYIYSGWQRIADYDGTSGSLQNRHIYGNSVDEVLITVDGSGNVAYLHHDRIGSIIATTNSSGTVTNTNSFGPFGETGTLAGTTFGFTGQRYDSELELYYYKNRYYSMKIGGFLQTDPIGYSNGELNLYTYVKNSPLNYIDPLGFDAEKPNNSDCGCGCSPSSASANGDQTPAPIPPKFPDNLIAFCLGVAGLAAFIAASICIGAIMLWFPGAGLFCVAPFIATFIVALWACLENFTGGGGGGSGPGIPPSKPPVPVLLPDCVPKMPVISPAPRTNGTFVI